MKKGFTLIELIAVIVIIGFLLVIVSPVVINVFNNSKEKLLLLTAERINNAAEVFKMDYEMQYNVPVTNIIFYIDNYRLNNDSLKIDGDLPESGIVFFNESGEVNLAIYNDGVCVIKNGDDPAKASNLTKEECNLYIN